MSTHTTKDANAKRLHRIVAGVALLLVLTTVTVIAFYYRPCTCRGVRCFALMPHPRLRTLRIAQTLFREGDKELDGEFDYARNLQELIDCDLVDASRYSPDSTKHRWDVGGDGDHWHARVEPLPSLLKPREALSCSNCGGRRPKPPAARWWYTDRTGAIRTSTGPDIGPLSARFQ
ncbi:hypothetical protein ACFL59_14975 [Planctomycetota bacterium]